MPNSRAKGARGEREAAEAFAKTFAVEARRGQQFAGGVESPDVVHGLAGVHLEVKRVEALRLYLALDQATRDAGANVPVVLHRPNGREWVAIIRLEDLPKLAERIASAKPKTECES